MKRIYYNYCKNKIKELGNEVKLLSIDEIEWKEFFGTDNLKTLKEEIELHQPSI